MRGFQLASNLSGALYGSLTPIMALMTLQPKEYGLFSIIYLVAAFGISLQYSVVSEAWARAAHPGVVTATGRDYSGALIALALFVAAAGVFPALFISELREHTGLFAVALLFTVLRSGTRYYAVAMGSAKAVFHSDAAGILAFAIAFMATQSLGNTPQIIIAWLASGGVGVLTLRSPLPNWRRGIVHWCRFHGAEIKPLIADSLLMDAGALGTPFLLAGLMGPQNFGIYRAISNVALPVRLLVGPVRPLIGRMHPQRLASRQSIVGLGVATALLSGTAYAVLEWVLPAIPLEFGTLSSLTPHAAAAALFVAGSLLGTIFYISCRTNSSPRDILLGRAVQTFVVVSMPLLGFLWFGLGGAIWGFSISSSISACVWAWLLLRKQARIARAM